MGHGVMELWSHRDSTIARALTTFPKEKSGMIYKNADVHGIIMILDEVQAHEHPGASAA